MKKLWKAAAATLLLVLAVGLFTACGDSADALVGHWHSNINEFRYEFRANGTGTRGVTPYTEDFRWEVSGSNITMRFTDERTLPEEWGFTIRRNMLTFTNRLRPGYVFEFERTN